MQINEVRDVLSTLGGVSGFEAKTIRFLQEQVSAFVDESWVDGIGNLICHKKGQGGKIVFYCGVDEEGIFVHNVTPEGFVYFNTVGNWNASKYLGKTVRFPNGLEKTVMSNVPVSDNCVVTDLYIAPESSSSGCRENGIKFGDYAVFSDKIIYHEDYCNAWYNHVYSGIVAMIKAIMQCGDVSCDAYFVFTVFSKNRQEGAITVMKELSPNIAISIEGILCDCGSGAVIPYALPGVVYQKKRIDNIVSVAEQNDISYLQMVKAPCVQGGGIILTLEQIMRSMGIGTATIGIPFATDENGREICSDSDISSVADLMQCIAIRGLE